MTVIDGDAVRQGLSSDLGFSRRDRARNLRRVGVLAAGIAGRRELREQIETVGAFVEVHVSTPLEPCAVRDRKGLYAGARAGLVTGFTGIDDPWEPPRRPDVEIDTTDIPPDMAARRDLARLESLGLVGPAPHA